MSASLNSQSDSTGMKAAAEVAEEMADLSLDQDEVLDVGMALGSLSGLSHLAACAATERSNRRYDERNHRMHESRMKTMGMEGEEKESEADDMSQQVLIRSPITHNHYPANGSHLQQPKPANPSQPSGLSTLAKAALVAAAIGGPIAGGLTGYFLSKPGTTTTIENPADGTGIGLVPPAKPKQIDP